ncbi:Hexaprenyldihydroxybenzoate methyltransferase, mitochondrial [Coemansia helicoidea]|uniref:Hexaprenyldihydroxybenzoate methyltransferase, mitochondrial n=1 Tax=Coemansia helicoidea TaxID=1286919 RepID=A0ACC1LGQ9_9FUNG|nr:Hexaprenyldihydroxybenzoate methyltransferase, mitochondrial [Coemansia helicoidea]
MLGRLLARARPVSAAARGGRAWTHSGAAAADGGSVCADEVAKFGQLSREWWSRTGAFKYLHTMNPARVRFIGGILADLGVDPRGSSAVDVGCGGGLAAEALGRLGLRVLGVDAAEASVGVARAHVAEDPMLAERVAYRVATAEQLVREGAVFDLVASLEVVEHVADPARFVESLVRLARPGAPIVVSTINRTPLAYLLDVALPEYVLGSVPRGTHDHAKFVPPSDLQRMLADCGADTLAVNGLVLNPLTSECHLVDRDCGLLRDAGVQANYILAARKRA